MNPVVRSFTALLLTIGMLLVGPALAVDAGDIVVVSLKGEVHVTMSGASRTVRAGSVLEPPASLRTGRDGAVELRQGATTLSVGPETLLEFPALEKRGAPIDRIVQPRGNVFYNIGKREGRRLRIETPFLVGVVKGTQFNVAAQDGATTISLFEGLLEVRSADDSSVVDLKAGEIASRQRDDQAIKVLRMGAGKEAAPVTPRQPAGSSSSNGEPKPNTPRAAPRQHDDLTLADSHTDSVSVGAIPMSAPPATAASGDGLMAPRDVSAPSLDTGVAVPVGSPVVDVSTATGVDAGPASVDTGVAVNVSNPAVDVSTSTTVDAGPVSVDTGAALNVSSPVIDVSTSTSVDAGPISVDAGIATGVDVGAGAVDTGVTAGVDAGPITTDVGVGADVDLDSGGTSTDVVVGASAGQVDVQVGSSTAVDTVAGTVNIGLDIAAGNQDLGVDLGVDLGLDNDNTTPSTDTGTDPAPETPGQGPPTDVVELLNTLIRRPGRK